MKSVSAVFCECCRKIFENTPAINTKNDMCVGCNRLHKVPEEKWVVTKEDYLKSIGKG